MHNVECNTFLAKVSTDIFLILQQEYIFIAVGIDVDKIMEIIIC
jgi:hypothetical protein